MLLPYLGGSPAVWNTCMVFFQVMLLAGYLYAHLLPRQIGNRKHAILHLVLLLTAALLLPIGVPEKAVALLPSASSAPVWLLTTLLTTVGLPFFILSTNAPLLQSWFSHTSHRRARDPYFLYAASNFGSLLALLSYPLLLEPNLKLRDQSLLWAGCYILGFVLIFICAIVFLISKATPVPAPTTIETEPKESVLRCLLEPALEVALSRVCSVEFDAWSNHVSFYGSNSGTFVVGCSFIDLPAHIHSPILTPARKHSLVGTLSATSSYVTRSAFAGGWHKPAALVLYTSAPGILLRGLHGMSRPTC